MLLILALLVAAATIVGAILLNPAKVKDHDSYGRITPAYMERSAKRRRVWRWVVIIVGVLSALTLGICSFLYSQTTGQGVIVTRLGGTIVKDDNTMGVGQRLPIDTVHKWDLFNRDISLSEPSDDYEETFENGEITGSRIATSVKSGKESGAQVWFDLDVTYNMDQADLMQLFGDFRSQDRFTRQIIYPALLNAANTVPSEYTTTQFRGAGSVEAARKIAEQVNGELEAKYGVVITVATIKNVAFDPEVEKSLSVVEQKQQQAEAAEADAAAKDVMNEQLIDNAKAEAKANREIAASITPELIELRKIEAYKEGTVFVVPDGSTPMINTAK